MEAARAFVNPLTALSLIERVKEISKRFLSGNQKSLVLFLGADSSVGNFFLRLAFKDSSIENLDIIPVIRNKDRAEFLKTRGDIKPFVLEGNMAFPE